MRRALLFVLAALSLSAQAIELKPFTASYTADWKQLPISGTAERSLKRLDDQRWQLSFEAAMLVASLTEESTFRLENNSFLPLTYSFGSCSRICGCCFIFLARNQREPNQT